MGVRCGIQALKERDSFRFHPGRGSKTDSWSGHAMNGHSEYFSIYNGMPLEVKGSQEKKIVWNGDDEGCDRSIVGCVHVFDGKTTTTVKSKKHIVLLWQSQCLCCC